MHYVDGTALLLYLLCIPQTVLQWASGYQPAAKF
jgi:hypothetical protein